MGEVTPARHHAEHTQEGEILLAWSRVRRFGIIRNELGLELGIPFRIRIRWGEFRDCHIVYRGYREGDQETSARRSYRVAQGFGYRVLGTGTWGIGQGTGAEVIRLRLRLLPGLELDG